MYRVFGPVVQVPHNLQSPASDQSADSVEFEEELFEPVAEPLQSQSTAGAIVNGLMSAAIDLTTPHTSTESTEDYGGGGSESGGEQYHYNTGVHSHQQAFSSSPGRVRSQAELEYYRDYDVMVGYRIAITLGTLILLFTVFVLYKTHCHQKRNQRLVRNATASSVPAEHQHSSSSANVEL